MLRIIYNGRTREIEIEIVRRPVPLLADVRISFILGSGGKSLSSILKLRRGYFQGGVLPAASERYSC